MTEIGLRRSNLDESMNGDAPIGAGMTRDIRTVQPVIEPIAPLLSESFVWRCDDYPQPWAIWNTHKECELHSIRNAEGTSYVGDHIGRFEPGDLYFIGGHLPHNWVSYTEQGEVLRQRDVVLQFDEDRISRGALNFPELSGLEGLFARARRGIVFHGETRREGSERLETIGKCTGLQRFAQLLELLAILSRTKEYTLLSSGTFDPKLDDRTNRILARVFAHLADHASGNIRLADVARLSGMTETSFSRFFRIKTGNTFSRHVMVLRIAKACELLARTDLLVTEICGEAGYENLSNFNRAFQAVRGLTPSRYRELSRQQR